MNQRVEASVTHWTSSRRGISLIAFAVGAVAFAVYLPSLWNGFVGWDDPYLILDNRLIRSLNWESLKGIFGGVYFTDYYPITVLSHPFDYRLWAAKPFGYHLTNAILHAANSVLVFLFFRRLFSVSGATCGSAHAQASPERGTRTVAGGLLAPAVAALLFAVHPIQVESVAWASERKNVLSMLLFLSSFLCFLGSRNGAGRGQAALYAVSLLLFALAVLSKASVVVLPLLLLAYLIAVERVRLRRSVGWAAPYLAVAIVAALLTYVAESRMVDITQYKGVLRDPDLAVQMMGVFGRYLALLALPMQFSAHEPHPAGEGWGGWQIASVAAMAIYTWLVVRAWRRDRVTFFCLVWFPIGLLPVSQIIPFPNLMATRYLYLPALGLFGAVSATATAWLSRQERPVRRAGEVLVVMCPVLFSLITVCWIGYWRDSRVLWRQTVTVSPDSQKALYGLGYMYDVAGQPDKAESHLLAAVSSQQNYVDARERLGGLYLRRGRLAEAQEHLVQAVRLDPKRAFSHMLLGLTLNQLGNRPAAVAEMAEAQRLDPSQALPHYYLGLWSYEADQVDEARKWLEAFLAKGGTEKLKQRAQEILGQLDHP